MMSDDACVNGSKIKLGRRVAENCQAVRLSEWTAVPVPRIILRLDCRRNVPPARPKGWK